MNQKFSEYRLSFKNKDTTSCSANTFFGTLNVLAELRPKIAILENVDSMGSESSQDSNLARAVADLRSIDNGMYGAKVFHLSADDYMLPQTRQALWVAVISGPGNLIIIILTN